jgi:outer membrane murein-binding lipoprotein Lpp
MNSKSDGAAFGATVQADDTAPPRTAAQQAYLDDLADAAEQAVADVEATIDQLEESLEARRAEAQRARDEADNNRISGEDQG